MMIKNVDGNHHFDAKPIRRVAEHLGLWPYLSVTAPAIETFYFRGSLDTTKIKGIYFGFEKDGSEAWIKSTIGIVGQHGGLMRKPDEKVVDGEELQIGSRDKGRDLFSLSAGVHLASLLTKKVSRDSKTEYTRYMDISVRSAPTEITLAWNNDERIDCSFQASFDPQGNVNRRAVFERDETSKGEYGPPFIAPKMNVPVEAHGEDLYFNISDAPIVESVAELVGHAIQGGKIRIRGPWRVPRFSVLEDPVAALNLAGQFEVSYIPEGKDLMGAATLIIGALSLNDFKP